MRNFNTSFIKNATSFFANEVMDVLGAIAIDNPANYLGRLIQSCVEPQLESMRPGHCCLSQLQPASATVSDQGTTANRAVSLTGGRSLSALVGSLDRAYGKNRWASDSSHRS